MNDLGVLTSGIRIRRKVHNPVNFPALRHQSRASGGYTHVPAPAATRAIKQPEPDIPTDLVAYFSLRADSRPHRLLVHLHELASQGDWLPSSRDLSECLRLAPSVKSDQARIVTDCLNSLRNSGAVTVWTSPEPSGNAGRERIIRLDDGRVLRTAGAPEEMP